MKIALVVVLLLVLVPLTSYALGRLLRRRGANSRVGIREKVSYKLTRVTPPQETL